MRMQQRLGLVSIGLIGLGVSIGLAAGVGTFTFGYARGASYLRDDPTACANCHVMQGHFDAWLQSSHRAVATCNDCHTPKGFVNKYWTKALNGWHHSLAFTTGEFHEPFRITSRNREIAEHSCRKCHQDMTQAIEGPHRQAPGAEEVSCLRCHGAVGHDL